MAPRHLTDGHTQNRLPSMKIRLRRNMNNFNIFHLINTNIKQDVEIFRRERRSTHLSTPGPSFCLGESVGINITLMPVEEKEKSTGIYDSFLLSGFTRGTLCYMGASSSANCSLKINSPIKALGR